MNEKLIKIIQQFVCIETLTKPTTAQIVAEAIESYFELKEKKKPREFRIAVIRKNEGIYLHILEDKESFYGAEEIIAVREIVEER